MLNKPSVADVFVTLRADTYFLVMLGNTPAIAYFDIKDAKAAKKKLAKAYTKEPITIQQVYVENVFQSITDKFRKNRKFSKFMDEAEPISPIGRLIKSLMNMYPLNPARELLLFLAGGLNAMYKINNAYVSYSYKEFEDK